jgi:hypothetical protein
LARSEIFSFVFIQLVPDGSSWETKNKWEIRFSRKKSQVENWYYTSWTLISDISLKLNIILQKRK